ncbi:hypothetical protein VPH35_038798 [Triticum aestivum]
MEEIIGNTAALEVAVPTSLEGAVPETQEVVPEPHDAVPAPMHLLPPRMHVVEDALEYIFRFMNGVHEEHMLDTIWIRSDTPYRIEVSLRMLHDTLFLTNISLHPACFNLVVRKLANAEVERHAGTNMVGSKHYFDLQFHAQSQAFRSQLTVQILMVKDNKAYGNIPEEIRAALRVISN